MQFTLRNHAEAHVSSDGHGAKTVKSRVSWPCIVLRPLKPCGYLLRGCDAWYPSRRGYFREWAIGETAFTPGSP